MVYLGFQAAEMAGDDYHGAARVHRGRQQLDCISMMGDDHQFITGWCLEHEFYISIQLGIYFPTDYVIFVQRD